ncbi:hypothetical protein HMPREF3224_02145 [Anaerococcus hydrogenalis]|nr:hypothetical protein HMPREF3224_02145 [Anaerococcus hydrogenalis]
MRASYFCISFLHRFWGRGHDFPTGGSFAKDDKKRHCFCVYKIPKP